MGRSTWPKCSRLPCVCIVKLNTLSPVRDKKELEHVKKMYVDCFETCGRWNLVN